MSWMSDGCLHFRDLIEHIDLGKENEQFWSFAIALLSGNIFSIQSCDGEQFCNPIYIKNAEAA